jgi:hypothetical protein
VRELGVLVRRLEHFFGELDPDLDLLVPDLLEHPGLDLGTDLGYIEFEKDQLVAEFGNLVQSSSRWTTSKFARRASYPPTPRFALSSLNDLFFSASSSNS